MISQNCPKCFSNRIRRGYRPTPLWSKFLFRYHLLCDTCNWEFTGFAVPGTVSTKSKKRSRKAGENPVRNEVKPEKTAGESKPDAEKDVKENDPVTGKASEKELPDAALKVSMKDVKKRAKANQ